MTRRPPRLRELEFGREREGIDLSKVVLTHHNLRNLGKRTLPDLDAELSNAIIDALDAHTSVSTQALNSVTVRNGIKQILLDHAHLWESLRAHPGP